MVIAYDMRHRRPHVFSSAVAAHRGPDSLMKEVARATLAGPTYFPPLELQIGADTGIFVDGGIAANNPSLLAYVAAVRAGSPSEALLVSLGTGAKTPIAPDSVTLASIASKDWLRVAVGLLSVSFEASSYFADAMLADLLGSDKRRQQYWRIQSPLVHADSEMDKVSPQNIAALTLDADELIVQRAADLQRIAEVLTAA